jgi:hypothetical protein
MSNDSKKSAKGNIKLNNKPSYLVRTFLISKRAIKSVYKLNTTSCLILRYIADSIELSTTKLNNNLSKKLYYSQIARYCFCNPKTVERHIKKLKKKRLVSVDNYRYSLGKVFLAWDFKSLEQEGGLKVPRTRRGTLSPLSNSSNLTNYVGYADITSQSTSFEKLENYGKLTDKQKENGQKQAKKIKDMLKFKPIGGVQ